MIDIQRLTPGSRPYLSLTFPPPPEGRPYVIVNMVGSIDGKAVVEGNEQGLGSAQDKARMQELRAHADAVLNGAGTMRKSGATSRIADPALVAWRREHGKQNDYPLGVLLTHMAGFELTGDYFDGSGLEAVIVGSDISPERAEEIQALGPRVVHIAEGGAGLLEALRYLREQRDVRLLLVEGGPTVNAQLLHLGVVDEFFLTLGPTLVGGKDTLTILEGDHPATKATVPHAALLSVIANDEASELYLRYRLHND